MAWKLARWRQTNFQPDQSWDYSTAGEGEDLSVVGNQACPERSPPLMEDVTGRRAPPHQHPAAAPWERMVNGTPWEQQRLLEAIRPTHDCWVRIQQVHLGQQVLQVSLRPWPKRKGRQIRKWNRVIMWRNRGKQEYLPWRHSFPSPWLITSQEALSVTYIWSSRAASEARKDACRNSTPGRWSANLPPHRRKYTCIIISNARTSLVLQTNHKAW
jgi:hypothetical protein